MWTILVLQGTGCRVVGLSTERVALMSLGLEETQPPLGEMFLKANSEGRLGGASEVPWNPLIDNREDAGRKAG